MPLWYGMLAGQAATHCEPYPVLYWAVLGHTAVHAYVLASKYGVEPEHPLLHVVPLSVGADAGHVDTHEFP